MEENRIDRSASKNLLLGEEQRIHPGLQSSLSCGPKIT